MGGETVRVLAAVQRDAAGQPEALQMGGVSFPLPTGLEVDRKATTVFVECMVVEWPENGLVVTVQPKGTEYKIKVKPGVTTIVARVRRNKPVVWHSG